MLDTNTYEDFFSTFLDQSEYKKLKNYMFWWAQITYWEKHPDPVRREQNIADIQKMLPSMKSPIQKLLQGNKKLKNGLGIHGGIFHEFAVREFQTVPQSMPLKLQQLEYKFVYSVNEYKALIALLLSLEINPNQVDSFFNQSPLCAAIGFDNIPYALALLEYSGLVDVDQPCSQSYSSNTPLLLSIQRGQTEVYTKLINSADVNLPDKYGLTALHWAMIMADDLALSLLIAHPAIKLLPAYNGKYPIDYTHISKESFSFCYNTNGHFLANQTAAPEFRPIIAHFWNNSEAFLEYREARKESIQKCIELFQTWQPSITIGAVLGY